MERQPWFVEKRWNFETLFEITENIWTLCKTFLQLLPRVTWWVSINIIFWLICYFLFLIFPISFPYLCFIFFRFLTLFFDLVPSAFYGTYRNRNVRFCFWNKDSKSVNPENPQNEIKKKILKMRKTLTRSSS